MYAFFNADFCAMPVTIKPAIVREMASLAHHAMLIEVYTTPKPGLVDRANNGSHQDMTVATFEHSAEAIAPWLALFTQTGIDSANLPANQLLPMLRPHGKQCERDMLLATAVSTPQRYVVLTGAVVCCCRAFVATR